MALVSYLARGSFYLLFPIVITSVALFCLLWVSLSPDTVSVLSAAALWIARILAIGFMLYVGAILFMFSFEAVMSLVRLWKFSRELKDNNEKKD